MVYNFFDKESSAKQKWTGINVDVVSENQQLAEVLTKTITTKFERH